MKHICLCRIPRALLRLLLHSTFDTKDIIVATLLVNDSDDEGSSFDPFIDDLPLFGILGTMFEEDKPRVGGSVVGRKYVHREATHHRLVTDYFASNYRFDGDFFQRKFRMRKPLFNKILKDVSAVNSFFTQKQDATFRIGITPLVKMTSTIRILSYACVTDTLYEWLKIGESTVIECLMKFCETVINIYAAKFMRIPNEADITRLLAKGEEHGFPGLLGSVDCINWVWKNCPVAWKGQCMGHTRESTLILEYVVDYELWIWHTFFGMDGSHNDLSVFENSHIFDDLMTGNAMPCNYVVNGVQYDMGYYFADGIYREWATLIQSLKHKPVNKMERYFVKRQESCWKDVERTFGILQASWNIVKQPTHFWDRKMLGKIMKTCVILHNIIIQDERGLNLLRW